MLRYTCSCLVLLLAFERTASAQPPRELTLDEALRLAEAANPDLRVLATTVDAANARLAGASLFLQNNPTVTATGGPRSSDSGNSFDFSLQLLQQFEIGGQRSARIRAAEAARDATTAHVRARRAEVLAVVRKSFGQALAAEQRVALTTEATAVAQEALKVAEERLRIGPATPLEVNTARIELGRASREQAEAERARSQAFGELRGLIALDPSATFTVKGDLKPSKVAIPSDAELLEQAVARRAEVIERRRALEAAKAELQLAERERIPSPRIGISYSHEQESSANILQAVLAIDLPLFNRNQAARGVAAAKVRELSVGLDATERQIKIQVATALDRLRAAQAAADGYSKDVVAAMEQNMQLVTETYRAGKIDFSQLIVIRRQSIEARREFIDVLEELDAAQVQLDLVLARTP